MKRDGLPRRIGSAGLWGIYLGVGSLLAFLGAFGIASYLGSWGILPASVDGALRWDLAWLLGVMSVLGIAAVLGAARLAFGTGPQVRTGFLVVPLVGATVAIAMELALHQWAEVHIGMYEFGDVMPTAVLSLVTIFAAVTGFATLVAPREAAFVPLVGSWAAAGIVCVIAIANVPGLMDGIGPESWPLAILIGFATLDVIGVAVVGSRVIRSGGADS